MCGTGGNWRDALPVIDKEDKGEAVLAFYIAAKDVLPAFHRYKLLLKVGVSYGWRSIYKKTGS